MGSPLHSQSNPFRLSVKSVLILLPEIKFTHDHQLSKFIFMVSYSSHQPKMRVILAWEPQRLVNYIWVHQSKSTDQLSNWCRMNLNNHWTSGIHQRMNVILKRERIRYLPCMYFKLDFSTIKAWMMFKYKNFDEKKILQNYGYEMITPSEQRKDENSWLIQASWWIKNVALGHWI